MKQKRKQLPENNNRQMESCFSGILHFMQTCRLNSEKKKKN